MLIDEMKARLVRARKERDEVVTNVLGLALGEVQTAEARAARTLTEDEVTAVVRKLLKSNEETLGLTGEADARAPVLRREIETLASFLPKAMSPEHIALALTPITEALRAAKTDGQAMGLAMKHLKAEGSPPVLAPDVQEAVKRLRA